MIVTGDLTQRAREEEFRHAAAFLDSLVQKLGAPVLAIPGNHDVSLFNPYVRFLKPFRAWDQWIGSRFPELYEDDTLCVVGLRTNDVRTVAEGRLTRQHAELCRGRFASAGGKLRLLAVHHPLLESLSSPYAREILNSGPEMVLSGHRHRYGIVKVQVEQKSVLSLSAGTAVSTRTREEENGFNWIEYSPSERRGEVRSLLLRGDRFEVECEEEFTLAPLSPRASHRHETGIIPVGKGPLQPAAFPLRVAKGHSLTKGGPHESETEEGKEATGQRKKERRKRA